MFSSSPRISSILLAPARARPERTHVHAAPRDSRSSHLSGLAQTKRNTLRASQRHLRQKASGVFRNLSVSGLTLDGTPVRISNARAYVALLTPEFSISVWSTSHSTSVGSIKGTTHIISDTLAGATIRCSIRPARAVGDTHALHATDRDRWGGCSERARSSREHNKQATCQEGGGGGLREDCTLSP